MATTTISLSDDQLARLQTLALSSGRSLNAVVREAVDVYLAGQLDETRGRVIDPPATPPDPAGRTAVDVALARLRAGVPADLTPEEIDAEIDAAWSEVRQQRRSRRAAHD